MTNKTFYLLISALFLFGMCVSPASLAQDESQAAESTEDEPVRKKRKPSGPQPVQWTFLESITGIYDTKFPLTHKYKIFPFQFNEDTIAFSSEMVSTLGGEGATNEKTIIIKAAHTYGAALSYKDVDLILQRETNRYAGATKALKGSLITNEKINHKGFPGKDLYIAYRENGKNYGMRIRIFLTNYAIVEQVLIGPTNTMYAYRSDDFFESFTLYDGIAKEENPLGIGWEDTPSPLNIFTAKLPPKNGDYTPLPPKFNTQPRYETMVFEIHDPVIKKKAYYNVYSYKLEQNVTSRTAKAALFNNHVEKFIKNASINAFDPETSRKNGANYMNTKLVIKPLKTLPHVDTVFLEARYKGDTVIVQEFLAQSGHANSGLPQTLFSLLKFHPEKYKAPPKPAPQAPETQQAGSPEEDGNAQSAQDSSIEEN